MRRLIFLTLIFCLIVSVFISLSFTAEAQNKIYCWQNPEGAEETKVKLSLNREALEDPNSGSPLYYWESLDPNITCYSVYIVPDFLCGYYISFTSVTGGVESSPRIIAEKPGNIVGAPGDPDAPLSFDLTVNNQDVSIFISLYRLCLFDPNSCIVPVVGDEDIINYYMRSDLDGSGDITSYDYSLFSYLYRYGSIMGCDCMPDKPVWGVLQ